LRIDARPYVERLEVRRTLFIRDVHAGAALVGDAVDLLVADNADDLPWHFVPELRFSRNDFLDQQPLSDRILVRELTVREALVDDQDRWRIPRVAFRQCPALDDGEPQRREVGRADDFEEATGAIGAVDDRAIRHLHRHAVAGTLQWRRTAPCG